VAFVVTFFAPILLFLVVLNVMTMVSESGSLVANALAIGLLLLATPAAVLLGTCSVVVFSYFWVRIYLAPFAASVDNLSPFSALRQSWSLTRHNWWHTFIPLVAANVAAYLLTRAASLVTYASPTGSVLVAVPLMTALTAPVTTTIGLAVYYDLRLRRGSYTVLANELGLPPAPPLPAAPPAAG
jgi:hypothetical protein